MTSTLEPAVDGAAPVRHVSAPVVTVTADPPQAVGPGVLIADPGPLGLGAFAGTTFVLSLFNAGLVGEAKLAAVVLPLALIYGGLAQLLAGMWEFRKNNTFAAVAFTSYGAFWISFFYFDTYIAGKLPPADAHTAVGIFLLMWTIFTAYMTLASVKTTGALTAVFGVILVTFVVLTIGEFAQNTTLIHTAGYIGLLGAALAWYASAAGVVNATWARTVLPVFPAKHN
jgi:hypothetical protein